jgi:methylenetetrahydrofolate dehydrogenase (NADP+) / methenyltetrahydrofolate cyclohydrolase
VTKRALSRIMPAMKRIDGRALAATIREEVRNEINTKDLHPGLGVLLVGDDPASHLYVQLKENAARDVGITTDIRRVAATVRDEELINIIQDWNADANINGILIQLPLPTGHNTDAIVAAMDPKKDADGFHPVTVKKLQQGDAVILPPVHEAVLRLIAATGTDPRGKSVTVLANSQIFADPLTHLLQKAGCITRTMHPDELDGDILRSSDIIVSAVGRAGFLGPDLVQPGAIVIDVGTSRDEVTGQIRGDADVAAFEQTDGWITPVPGGVGPMTVALLLKNVLTLTTSLPRPVPPPKAEGDEPGPLLISGGGRGEDTSMPYWLLKTEPDEYSWEQLQKDTSTTWTGVRNFQARNNLRAAAVGDLAFIYHTGDEKMIVGLARITKPAFPDPTAETGDWASVELEVVKPLVREVTLEEIKNTHGLAVMPLVTAARLSVQPVTDAQAEMILKIAKTTI